MLIGADAETIRKAEDRELFKQCMEEIGLENAQSAWPTTLMKLVKSAMTSACPAYCGPALRSEGQEAASHTTAKSLTRWSPPRSSSAPSIRS